MIGLLNGIILFKKPSQILLDVQGVGYEVEVSVNALDRMPDIGQSAKLHTHLIVREDAHTLYGFFCEDERNLFRILLKVNGVGPRLAMTILSHMTPDEFVRCIAQHDVTALTKLPGIGKKTAERLIIDIHDRLKDWAPGTDTSAAVLLFSHQGDRGLIIQDAIAALIALGYKPAEARRMVEAADDGVLSAAELIRRSLRGGKS